MVNPRDTYCPLKGIRHATLTTRGCPHCLLDLQPELGPIPLAPARSTTDILQSVTIKKEMSYPSNRKQEAIAVAGSSIQHEMEAIDLTSPKRATSKPRFDSFMANRAIIESTRQSGFKNTSKGALKLIPKAGSSTIMPTTLLPKAGAETRPVTIIIGPYMGSQKEYSSIGVSTYTFSDRQEYITNWSNYIRDHILPNHIGWNDHALHGHSIQRYLIATQWSKTRGPTILGKKESNASTVSEFLTYFPSTQSTIYVIVEFVVEDSASSSEKATTKEEKKTIKMEGKKTIKADERKAIKSEWHKTRTIKRERNIGSTSKHEHRQSMPDISDLRKRTREVSQPAADTQELLQPRTRVILRTPSPNQLYDPFRESSNSRSPLRKRIRAFTSRFKGSRTNSVYKSHSPENVEASTQSLPAQLSASLFQDPAETHDDDERITIASLLGE